MVEVSIVCLIYKSCGLADYVYESLWTHTPKLHDGTAEFFFVANDPSDALLLHLSEKNYPFVLNRNHHHSDEELFAQGFGKPEHMNRVYKGYNQGILHAKGDKIVLINSDNFFSEDWLENLLKYSEYLNVVCSTLVEPKHPKYSVFPGAIEANFGNSYSNFDEDSFATFVKKTKKTGIRPGGAYMPCLLYKNLVIYAGLYPEGNIAGKTFDEVAQYGDKRFYETLSELGVVHITAMDSIVYHLKEGEMDESVENNYATVKNSEMKICEPLPHLPKIERKPIMTSLHPTESHASIMSKLMPMRYTVPGTRKSITKRTISYLKKHGVLKTTAKIITVFPKKIKSKFSKCE